MRTFLDTPDSPLSESPIEPLTVRELREGRHMFVMILGTDEYERQLKEAEIREEGS